MFDKFLHPKKADDGIVERPAPPPPADGAGDTATVRRIVAKLEAMPPDQARLLAAAAYTLARAANADLDISDDETSAIERELQAKTVGGTEDYVVTREFKAISTPELRLRVLRACFAISAANGTISAEETAVLNQIAEELDIDDAALNAIR